MTELLLTDTGDRLEVEGGLKYTFQSSEIGDISEIKSNWGWSFKIPETPNNRLIFAGLGLVGSTSNVPYVKIKCAIIQDSDTIITDANLKVTGYQNGEYDATVNGGIVEFFDKILNDKLTDIPSVISRGSGLTHDKNLTNISNSWTGSGAYRYIIADYNGKLNADPNYVDFDSAYLVPSVNVKWLMDEIFLNYGWTYVGLPDINLDWMTYGNKVQDSGEVGAIVGLLESDPITFKYGPVFGYDVTKSINILTVPGGNIDATYITNNGTDIEINQSDNYKIEMPVPDYSNMPNVYYVEYLFKKNGVQIFPSQSSYNYNFGALTVGDKISVFAKIHSHSSSSVIYERDLILRGAIKFIATDVVITNVQSPSMNQKVSDFIKEVMMRYAVIAIADVSTKEITFYDIDDRLAFPILDWSKKYVKRVKESYAYQDYAIRNYLRHTYETEGLDYHDGFFSIDNDNLEKEKTIFKSKGFPSNQYKVSIDVVNSLTMEAYKYYEIEETNQGQKYKPLNNRFSFLREFYLVTYPGIKINGTLYGSFSSAIARDFDVIVKEKYKNINEFISRVKIIEIDLLLNFIDIKNLSFEHRYYFDEEKAFFLLNKLTWDSNKKIHRGEFLKITSNG